MEYIILTDAQAAHVAGFYKNNAELRPYKMLNGEWILHVAVITDNNYSDVSEYLSVLPTKRIDDYES